MSACLPLYAQINLQIQQCNVLGHSTIYIRPMIKGVKRNTKMCTYVRTNENKIVRTKIWIFFVCTCTNHFLALSSAHDSYHLSRFIHLWWISLHSSFHFNSWTLVCLLAPPLQLFQSVQFYFCKMPSISEISLITLIFNKIDN